jgi:triosephosphate isomerase
MGHVVAPGARPLIGTSWKMNLTRDEAETWLRQLLQHRDWGERTVFVLPPFTAIGMARYELAGSGILFGAQNVHHQDWGAFTGEISAPMLAALDCRIVEVGHSERRRYQGEDDTLIGLKVAAILRHGMWPLVCVGESGPQRDAGQSGEVVTGQLELILGRLSDDEAMNVLVAYEPWWAIGAGAIAAPLEHVARLHGLIHGWLARRWAEGTQVPVLYGGSVDEPNATALLATPGVDGLFVGRAALDAQVFARIAGAGLASD